MASSTGSEDAREAEIRLWREGDWWVARDVETGVTTQGETRAQALSNLDDAVALHEGTAGRKPTDEELQELGVVPENNATGDEEPPDVLD